MKTLVAVLALSTCLSGQNLRKIGAIDLPGPKGQRFDYLTMDDEDHYLLSAHLGPGILYVIDVCKFRLCARVFLALFLASS